MFLAMVETVQDKDDYNQLVNIIDQASETVSEKAGITLADVGYHSGANITACEWRNQEAAIPEYRKNRAKPACLGRYNHDASNDIYICPSRETLKFI